jgi:integrase
VPRAKLNKRFVDQAPLGKYYDTGLTGFGLYVGETAKTYFIEYRPGRGRAVPKRRFSFAKHGGVAPGGRTWTADLARAEALRLLGMVKGGIDPHDGRDIRPNLVADLVPAWLGELAAKRKARTNYDYRRLMERHALPRLGRLEITSVNRQHVAKLHHALHATQAEANHLLRVLSSFFSWCERHGYRPDHSNPCRHIVKYRENKRDRFLSPRELHRLSRALAAAERCGAVTPWVAGAIRLLVLTGARLGEVLNLQWAWVDLERGELRLPDSKVGARTIHLNAPARAVLAALPRVAGNPHVIVGGKPGAGLVNLEKPWRKIRKAALLNDVRLHDLRHSHASVAVAGGLSLPLVGALLGHALPATTARYAHLAADPIKAASELVGQRIAEAMKGRPGKVVALTKA